MGLGLLVPQKQESGAEINHPRQRTDSMLLNERLVTVSDLTSTLRSDSDLGSGRDVKEYKNY